jgi:SAM-dependent methyltransferase
MTEHECRACRRQDGHIVLDLDDQPACDYFPTYDDSGPDPVYPLQMWLCAHCGLAQLLADPTTPEEPKGAEPAALVTQAADAVARVTAAGLLPAGARVAEYGSPHGGSWLDNLAGQGLKPVHGGGEADVILDCFGMMHAADQAAALAERAGRLAPGGVLLLQFHSIETILRTGQWNALRHGHFAYYSATALAAMMESLAATSGTRLSARTSWLFDLYGGTVLLAVQRDGEGRAADDTITALRGGEERAGVTRPAAYERLQRDVRARAGALHGWLAEMKASGKSVVGYGAASRAVALLRTAGVDADLLPAVADASPGKVGTRMPGTRIPVITPAELVDRAPDAVALFVPDLLAEVRAAYPQVEAAGGQWVDADALGIDR